MNKRYHFWGLQEEVIYTAEQKVRLTPTVVASDVANEIVNELAEMYDGKELISMITDYLYLLAKDTAEELREE